MFAGFSAFMLSKMGHYYTIITSTMDFSLGTCYIYGILLEYYSKGNAGHSLIWNLKTEVFMKRFYDSLLGLTEKYYWIWFFREHRTTGTSSRPFPF